MPVQLADCAVNQECPQCGGNMLIVQSRQTSTGRYRRFECKKCQHRFNVASSGAIRARQFDDAAVMAIRQSADSLDSLAAQHGCSRELIRQIRIGKIYKDSLPAGFRPPPKASDPTCERCKFWSDGCSMGFPDAAIEGPGFAYDCSAFAAVTPPASSAPCCVSTQGDRQSPAG